MSKERQCQLIGRWRIVEADLWDDDYLDLVEPAPVEAIGPDGRPEPVEHGANLRLRVRPEAPVQLLVTGHIRLG